MISTEIKEVVEYLDSIGDDVAAVRLRDLARRVSLLEVIASSVIATAGLQISVAEGFKAQLLEFIRSNDMTVKRGSDHIERSKSKLEEIWGEDEREYVSGKNS